MGMPEEVRSTFTGAVFGPPCSEAALARPEATLGEELPPVLRELYRAFNGFLIPHGTALFWPLFAPKPGYEGLVETNQRFRQGIPFPPDLVEQCLFFGDPGYGPESAWGIKR